jgi:hypothetical protein
MKTNLVNWTLTVLFLLFAYWQLNDPDPELWVPIYLFPAVVCTFSALGKTFDRRVLTASLVILVGFMFSYLPDFVNWFKMGTPSIVETMKAEKPYVELTREFGGLVIVVSVLLWQWRRIPPQ